MMLTSDISLLNDPAYKLIVQEYANDMAAYDNAFSHAWYKLTSRDMGPHSRCIGDLVPNPQPFQYPLPPTPSTVGNVGGVRKAVNAVMNSNEEAVAMLTKLAFNCASTFRQTDFLGGCDGARVRFEPEAGFLGNEDVNDALELLESVKEMFEEVSYADLIVLAGNEAVARSLGGMEEMKFCAGRTDAVAGDKGSEYLKVAITGLEVIGVEQLKDGVDVLGLTQREFVALSGGHDLEVEGGWSVGGRGISHEYYKSLLNEEWEQIDPVTWANGGGLYASIVDVLIVQDSEMKAIAQEFAQDGTRWREEFKSAWGKVMHADVFYDAEMQEEMCGV